MASTYTTLDAAATERKARLAKLASLKRKQPHPPTDDGSPLPETSPSITTTYLSGRNYDASTRGPRLGFETLPNTQTETLEDRAAAIETATATAAAEEEQAEKPIDLFKLQPKKPNWDLKRDLARKLEGVGVRTENAVARLVRERVERQKRGMVERGVEGERGGEGEVLGMQGEELVQGVHVREREEAEEERREREVDEDEV